MQIDGEKKFLSNDDVYPLSTSPMLSFNQASHHTAMAQGETLANTPDNVMFIICFTCSVSFFRPSRIQNQPFVCFFMTLFVREVCGFFFAPSSSSTTTNNIIDKADMFSKNVLRSSCLLSRGQGFFGLFLIS